MKAIMIPAVMLAGCAANVPAPELCDMPPGFRSWQGARVVWTGVVVGESHHGYILACEHRARGIAIAWGDGTAGGEAFQQALDSSFLRDGLLRITAEGRIGRVYGPDRFGLAQDPPVLRITAVRSGEFVPMSDAEMSAFHERGR